MKVATTLTLAFICCASAFGLNGQTTSVMKKVGFDAGSKPMVQAIDVQGNRLGSNMVRAAAVDCECESCKNYLHDPPSLDTSEYI